MADQTNDILVEIKDENLPKVVALYKKKAPWAPQVFGLVQTVVKWKKSQDYRNLITVMSPNNSWEEDGTIIASIFQGIFVFTLDEACANLYKGLSQSRRLKFGSFLHVHEKHINVVRRVIEEKGLLVVRSSSCFLYSISSEEASSFRTECPKNVFVEKLKPAAAKQINDAWPHKFPNSEKNIATYIEANGGYGVFLKSDPRMVAWGVKNVFGNLGMVQTEEGYKRKGYGNAVAKILAKDLAQEEYTPLAVIQKDNEMSINMFEKLGFKCIGSSEVITLRRN